MTSRGAGRSIGGGASAAPAGSDGAAARSSVAPGPSSDPAGAATDLPREAARAANRARLGPGGIASTAARSRSARSMSTVTHRMVTRTVDDDPLIDRRRDTLAP